MPLQTTAGVFLTSKEAATHLDLALQSFWNLRAAHGDALIRARTDLIPGRKLFALAEVEKLRQERAR